jgi:hypothetical protein
MKHEDIERMLCAMPLRIPRHMPETMPLRTGLTRRLTRAAWNLVSFKIPLWQAAAALLVLWTLSQTFLPDETSLPTQVPLEVNLQQIAPTPTVQDTTPARILTEEPGPWTLPERYRRMVEAARKKRPWERRTERSAL